MVAAKRRFEGIVLIKPDEAPLDFEIEPCSRRSPCSGVGPRGRAQLPEERNLGRQGGAEVQSELAFREPAANVALIRGPEAEIAESGPPERGVRRLRIDARRSRLLAGRRQRARHRTAFRRVCHG